MFDPFNRSPNSPLPYLHQPPGCDPAVLNVMFGPENSRSFSPPRAYSHPVMEDAASSDKPR